MAQQVHHAVAILILAALPWLAAVDQAQPEGQKQSVTVTLPEGAKLPPGRHRAVMEVSGQRIQVEVSVPLGGAAEAVPSSSQPAVVVPPVQGETAEAPASPRNVPRAPANLPTRSARWVPLSLAAILPVFLIAIAAWIYIRIIQPRKQIEPYRNALELIKAQKYGEALPKLTELEGKLHGELRRDARFFIAFACQQLKQTEEAEHTLVALHRENPKDATAAYLLAYIRVAAKRYDDAEEVLERMEANGQLGVRHAKKLLGMVKFSRAIQALRDGRVDAAAELFEKVQALGDFANQIPSDLRNRHVVFGTRALFENDVHAARKHFESLERGTGPVPRNEREPLVAMAKLGLALAEWLEATPDSGEKVEQLLAQAAKLLEPEGPLELEWPAQATAKDIAQRYKELDAKKEEPVEKKDTNLCLRDIHLLRGMNVLRAWGWIENRAARQEMQKRREAVLGRLACALAHDAEFSDGFLVAGLLLWYLGEGDQERGHGLDLLQEARKRGMRDPETLELLTKRERKEEAAADVVDRYLQVLDKYLNDDTVQKEVRLKLLEQQGRFSRASNLGKRPDLSRARSVPATVKELYDRSANLRVHIQEILQSQEESEQRAKVKEISEKLEQEGDQLSKQAEQIQRRELELLEQTGKQLLPEK